MSFRVSTLWHYIGYIQIPKEKTQIEQINERREEYNQRKAAPVIEEIDDVGTNDIDEQNDRIEYDNEMFNEESENPIGESQSDDEVFDTSDCSINQNKF